MHALIDMVRELRKGKAKNGLVLANGGILTYQYVVCLSSRPRKDNSYPDENPLPNLLEDVPVPIVDEQVEGMAIIETYTVEFNRDGSPLRACIVGRLQSNNHRFIANHGNDLTLKQLSNSKEEQIGQIGYVVRGENGKNLFKFVVGRGGERKLKAVI